MNAPEKNVPKVAPVDFKTAPHFPIYMDYSATTPIDPRVADIIIAVDEPLDATQCGGKENCNGAHTDGARCMTHELWSTLNEKMVDYLDSVSLQDLVDQQKQKNAEQNVVVMHRNEHAALAK